MIARGGRLGGAAHGDTVATYAPFNPSRRPRRRRRDAFQTRVRVHVSPFNVSPPSKTRTIRKVRVLRPSSSSLPRDRGAPLELRHWRGGRGTGASGARKQRGVLRATFRTRRAYFFSLAGGSSDRPVIGVTSDRALESEKWRSRWAAGDSSCRDRAWTMPGPYAFRAFLSWPGTVSRGCMTRGNTRVWWRTVVIFVFPSRERGESLFRRRVNE